MHTKTSLTYPILLIGGEQHLFIHNGQRCIINANNQGDFRASLYPVKILRELCTRFRAAPVFHQHYNYDHKEILGLVKEIKWSEAAQGVVGWLHPAPNLADDFFKLYTSGGPRPGVSGFYNITCDTISTPNGDNYKWVTKINKITAVDLVSEPTAGGKFLSTNEAHHYFAEPKPVRMTDYFVGEITMI